MNESVSCDFRPAAAPDATVSPPTCESDAEKNEAVQNTATTPVPEAETCSKSPAKSPLTPLDVIIEELKGCREQWLKAQSQLDHSVTKAKELEGQVAKLRAASEGWCFNSSDHDFQSLFHPLTLVLVYSRRTAPSGDDGQAGKPSTKTGAEGQGD